MLEPTPELIANVKAAKKAKTVVNELIEKSRDHSQQSYDLQSALNDAEAKYAQLFNTTTDPEQLTKAKQIVDELTAKLAEVQKKLTSIEQAIVNAREAAKNDAQGANQKAKRMVNAHFADRERDVRSKLEAAVQDFLEFKASQHEWHCDESALYDIGILVRTPANKRAAVMRQSEMRRDLLSKAGL